MTEIVFWTWWIVAGVLLVGELLTVTTYLLWMAVAAFITGLAKWIWPAFDIGGQLLLFAIVSVLAVYLFKRWQGRRQPVQREQLNNRAEQMIGRLATLDNPIINGSGHVKFGDTLWLVSCDTDLPAGTNVRVIAVNGTTLRITVV